MKESPYFRYSVSLRIFCDYLDTEEISAKLNLTNTNSHSYDIWVYKVRNEDEKHINHQLIELWNSIKAHKSYLIALKKRCKVDIFCSYTSDSDHAGVEISPEALEVFTQLGIPFGLSIIVL